MYTIDRTAPSLIPGNKRYHFCSRAKALLARWEPILLQDVDCYQWLNTDPMILRYVPQRSGMSFNFAMAFLYFESYKLDYRKSSTAIDLIYSRARMHQFYL